MAPALVFAQVPVGLGGLDPGGVSNLINPPVLSAAWVSNCGMTEYFLDAVAIPVGDPLGRISFDYDYDALQLGVSLPATVGNMGIVTISGALAIPSTGNGAERSFRFSTGQLRNRREWDSDTYYANLQGLCSFPIFGDFSVLGGFRWSNWQTSYKNHSNPIRISRYAETDTGDVTVNNYLPFVGVMIEQGGLSVGAIGFPVVLGDIQSRWSDEPHDLLKFSGEFSEGYFLETFLEYGVSMANLLEDSDVSFGIIFKISTLRAKTTVDLNRIRDFTLRPVQPYDLVLQRKLITLGANATLNFSLPDIGGLM